MSSIDSVLSSPLLLTAVFCGVVVGFGLTLLFLHIHDTRVFDMAGHYILSPASSLWDVDIANCLRISRSRKRLSLELCRLLSDVGDGNIVAYNSPAGRQTVIVAHPELVKQILSGHHLKFSRNSPGTRFAFFMGGNGLLTAEGSRWHDSRQMLGPAFQTEHVNAMLANFNRQSQKLVAYWRRNIGKLRKVEPHASSIPVRLVDDVDGLVMSAMCGSCFGYDFQADPNRDTISAAYSAVREELGARCTDPYDWWHLLSPARTRTSRAAVHALWALLDETISQRLSEHAALLSRRAGRLGSALSGPVDTTTIAPPHGLTSIGSPPHSQGTPDRAGLLSPGGAKSPLLPLYASPSLSPRPTEDSPLAGGARAGAGAPESLLQRMFAVSPQKPSGSGSSHSRGGSQIPAEVPALTREVSLNSIEAASSPLSVAHAAEHGGRAEGSSGGGSGEAGMADGGGGCGGRSGAKEKVRDRERDLLDWLVQQGSSGGSSAGEGKGASNCLSRTEMRDHLCTLLVAGHDAVSACLQWAIYELCRHPEVQERCQREIDAATASPDGTRGQHLTHEDVNKLSYLVQVLKESMRLHPVTGSIARRCEADCVVGDYRLRRGTALLVSVLAVHRHPDFWADPLLFRPERFSKDNIRATIKHPYQYLPFSAGPHSCVGQRMGLMQVLVVLATLLGQFTFSLAAKDCKAGVQEEETFTLHPKELNVVVSLRR